MLNTLKMKMNSIESELKDVHKKLNDIEKKQEMMKKLYDLEREQQEKMGKRPSTHLHEMSQKYIIVILDIPVIMNMDIKEYGQTRHTILRRFLY